MRMKSAHLASALRCVTLVAGLMAMAFAAAAQASPDSLRKSRADSVARRLAPMTVKAERQPGTVTAAPRVAGGIVTTGAKSEVVQVAGQPANLAEKVARQIYAEVPGIFVYDMDGSGNQINISARGLDAHRSWEFNVRQNGVLSTSDLYAYPASHYSAPMEAVERVEIVHGTAALQYGSQFGGLLNYVIKSADTTRRAVAESRSTAGSSGLAETWNAVGGRIGVLSYYTYLSLRRSDGYRNNGGSRGDAEYLSLGVPLTSSLALRAEAGRSRYLYRQPGPLNDAMFAAEPEHSTRSRNYYSPDITVPSLTLTWTPSAATKATLVASGVFGTRSSVAVGGFATAVDTPSSAGVWNTRQVDVDRYTSRTLEMRVLHDASVGELPIGLSAGFALTDNDTRRRQLGIGSRGSDYSLVLEPGGAFKRDLHYRTRNVAAYGESAIHLTPAWTVIPGVRVERGATHLTGVLAYYDPADTPRDIEHHFPLFGVRSSYAMPGGGEWYGGWSQAYRPMILKDVLPESITERTDRNLKDASGWTMETGMRGSLGSAATYDVAAFLMRYTNRFGLLTVTDSSGTPYTYKTNVGTTRTLGLEARLSLPLGTAHDVAWRTHVAGSLMDARYAKGSGVLAGRNVDISGNEVESAPRLILRSGLSAHAERGDASIQLSHVSRTFADALNTVAPTATGAVGIVPAYTLIDVSGSWSVARDVRVYVGVNNLFDHQYFTKRPQFYPGPGVWPSDGRTMQVSLSALLPAIH